MIEVSVVIPTHQRQASLVRTLDALARQDYAPDRFEVVVAIDGDSDRTGELLRDAQLPFALHTVAFDEPRGAGAARNLGAAAASGPVLLFLDDDIEAGPGLLRAHVEAHERGANVSTGYLRTETAVAMDLFQVALRNWWEAMFEAMRRPAHRFGFRDVLTGNCAIDARLFREIRGFDEAFRCHEDYEIGVRALAASAEVCFAEQAAAVHHECTTLPRAFARKRDEGRADVQMLRKHPALVRVLPLGVFEEYATRMQSLIRRLVFERPAVARLVAGAFTRSLHPLESARLRGRWQRRVHELLHYWYWLGVRDAIHDFESFEALRAACRSDDGWRPRSLDIDLAQGLSAAIARIDRERPDSVTVVYGDELAGDIPALPGSERLKGEHLRGALARELAGGLVSALGRAGVVPVDIRPNVVTATGPIPAVPLRL